jgi:hypothetical protein
MKIKKYSEHDDRFNISDIDDIMVNYTDAYDIEYEYSITKKSINLSIFFIKKDGDHFSGSSYDGKHRDMIRKSGEILKDLRSRLNNSEINRTILNDIRKLWDSSIDIMEYRNKKYLCYFTISIPRSIFKP